MGLFNLKRKPEVELKPTMCSVDTFIEDADAYAAGFPRVIIELNANKVPDRRQQDRNTEMATQDPVDLEFKHATFTLTAQSIDNLAVLAKRDQFNKSKLIRILLENHINKSRTERVQIYQKTTTV